MRLLIIKYSIIGFITFAQIPANALYLIKNSVTNKNTYYAERTFTYENGMISWW